MNLEDLQEQIGTIIARYKEDYPLNDLVLFKFKARYNHLLRDLDFNLATFGVETLIQYLTLGTNKERFDKLDYYTNILAKSDPSSRSELFILYATERINEAFISFLRTIPQRAKNISKQHFNEIMFKIHCSMEEVESIPQKLEVWKEYFNKEIEGKIEIPEMFRETPPGRLAYSHKFDSDVVSS